jgi:hypothetical protein
MGGHDETHSSFRFGSGSFGSCSFDCIFPIGTAMAQSCENQALSATGKPLHGAAKNSFVKKCKKDVCESKAVSAEGKPLHGAAKNSFMAKCKRDA